MKRILILFLSLIFLSSCSQKMGMTSSKIKFFGSNSFSVSSLLATKAKNGLIVYGKSLDGKTFVQKISDDSFDLILPNGSWNIYAIAWGDNVDGSVSSIGAYLGDTYCAKSENIKLTGADATISLTLSNVTCSDTALSAFAKTTASGNIQTISFPGIDFQSCRDVTSIVDGAADKAKCSRELNNTGFATYFKLVIPQYKRFGNGLEAGGDAITSGCIPVDIKSPDASQIANLKTPEAMNGLAYTLRLYYSKQPCDDSTGIDEVVIAGVDTPRTKSFIISDANQNKKNMIYFSSNENQLCQPPRLGSANPYAGGLGTSDYPYSICTEAQFNEIGNQFSAYKDNSFELANDLDFKFGLFNSIGETTYTATQPTSVFTGSFFGNNHKVQNILINPNFNGDGFQVGFFRAIDGSVSGSIVRDLTINKIATMNTSSFDEVGLLAGNVLDVTLNNIKIFGHSEGSSRVGGVVGVLKSSSRNGSVYNIHAEVDVQARSSLNHLNQSVGGIFGELIPGSALIIDRVSMKGNINANTSDGNFLEIEQALFNQLPTAVLPSYFTTSVDFCASSTSCSTREGRFIAKVQIGSKFFAKIDQSFRDNLITNINPNLIGASGTTVVAGSGKIIQAIKFVGTGGIIGYINNGSSLSLSNATVMADLIEGEDSVGGVVGVSGNSTTIKNTFSEANITANVWGTNKLSSKLGGVVGSGTAANVSNNIAIGVRLFLTANDSSAGGILGNFTSAPSIFANNYYYGQSGNSFGTSILPTTTGGYNKNSYSTSMFFKSFGSGAPIISGISGDTYFDVDSNLAYVYLSTPTPSWQLQSNPPSWVMPVDGNNFPRLAYELNEEKRVPYLKRECMSPTYFTATGVANANGGQVICNQSQIVARSGLLFPKDTLGQNIYSSGTYTTTIFPNGIYRFDGQSHSLINFNTTGESIFANLQVGSLVENLKIIGSNINFANAGTVNNIGLLAQVNNGKISNVKTIKSNVSVTTNSLTGVTPFSVGGLVGVNAGTITGGEINTQLSFSGTQTGTLTKLFGGVVAGSSAGVNEISAMRINGSISRFGFTGPINREYYAGVVGNVTTLTNSNTYLKEIDTNSQIYFQESTLSNTAFANAGPVYAASDSSSLVTMEDFLIRPNVNTNGLTINSPMNLKQGLGAVSFKRGFEIIYDANVANAISDFTGYDIANQNNYNVFYIYQGSQALTNTTIRNYNSLNLAADNFDSTWNIGTDFVNSILLGKTWRLNIKSGAIYVDPPELVKTGGSFEDIGLGF